MPRKKTVAWIVIGCAALTLLAATAGIAVRRLYTWFEPVLNEAIEEAEVSACQANLREIHKALILYRFEHKGGPKESGVRFFAAPFARGAVEHSRNNAVRLSCPAVSLTALTIGDLPWEEWWVDLDAIDGDYSAYAGRDQRNFPLSSFPAARDKPLVACDNDSSMNHHDVTNVLFGDGSIRTYSLEKLKAEGIVPEDAEILVVGPDSPVAELRKLSLN